MQITTQIALYRDHRAWYAEIREIAGWMELARLAAGEGLPGVRRMALSRARVCQEQAMRLAACPEEFRTTFDLGREIEAAWACATGRGVQG